MYGAYCELVSLKFRVNKQMSDIDILKQFKLNLITFVDELINQFPSEGDLVMFRIFLKDKIPMTDIINYFVHKILPLKKMIADRNEDFFLNHCTLFDSLQTDKDKINNFKKLWRSPSLDADDKKIVWAWFDTFVLLASKYSECKSNK